MRQHRHYENRLLVTTEQKHQALPLASYLRVLPPQKPYLKTLDLMEKAELSRLASLFSYRRAMLC